MGQLFSTDSNQREITCTVVYFQALDCATWLEFHHICLIQHKSYPKIGCLLDFTPLNQSNPDNLPKMLLGNSIPGEIRIWWIDGKYF